METLRGMAEQSMAAIPKSECQGLACDEQALSRIYWGSRGWDGGLIKSNSKDFSTALYQSVEK